MLNQLKSDALKQIRRKIPNFHEEELNLVVNAARDSFKFVREKADELRALIIKHRITNKEMNELPDKQLKALAVDSAENFVQNLGVEPDTARALILELHKQTPL